VFSGCAILGLRRVEGILTPWAVLSAAAGLALLAFKASGLVNLVVMSSTRALPSDAQKLLLSLSAGFGEELAKGVCVVALFVVFQRLDDTIDGIVVAVTVAVAFNLYETADFTNAGGPAAYFQVWMRQAVGLPLGHVTFTALTGAAVGWVWLRHDISSTARVMIVSSCLLLAGAAHASWDMFSLAGGMDAVLRRSPVHIEWVQLFVVVTLVKLVWQGPFAIAVFLAFRSAAIVRRLELGNEIVTEAMSGRGAITWKDAPVLVNAARSRSERFRVMLHDGFHEYRRVCRTRRLQLELLALRRRCRRRSSFDDVADGVLRRRLLEAGMMS